MKDMLRIHTDATREQMGEVIGLEGFLSSGSWGLLWWFPSIEERAAAIEKTMSAFPSSTCEIIEKEPVVESDKAVIDEPVETEEVEADEGLPDE